MERVPIRLVPNLKAFQPVGIMLCYVARDLRVVLDIPIQQSQRVNHSDIGCFRERKQLIYVGGSRNGELRPVRSAAADTQILYADGPEQVDQILIPVGE
jgi:hypothetical protein